MKTFLFVLAALSVSAFADKICVKVTDAAGLPVAKADVVAILKSGAYQDAKLDQGEYKCEPTEQCVKIYAAAPGYEAVTQKWNGSAGTVTVAMKPSATKSSAVIRRSGELPNIEGNVVSITVARVVNGYRLRKLGSCRTGSQFRSFRLNTTALSTQ